MSNNKNRLLFEHETSKVGIGTDNPHSALHIVESDVFGTHPTVQLEAPDPSIVFSDNSNSDAKFSIRYNAATSNSHNGLQFFNTLSDNTPMLSLNTSNCVGINSRHNDLVYGASLVVSTTNNWSEDDGGTQPSLVVGGPDTQRQVIHINANAFDFPGGGQTDNSGQYSEGAFWAVPMIYRSGDWQGTTPRPFPFDQWGELILQGT